MNHSEIRAREDLINEGWKVLRNGWPDFLCTRMKEGKMEFMVCEVKTPNDKLREEQLFVKRFFEMIDIPYVIKTIREPAKADATGTAKPTEVKE